MQTGIVTGMKKLFLALSMGCMVWLTNSALAAPAAGEETKLEAKAEKQQPIVNAWQEFHAVAGKCRVSFPSNPEHVSQRLTTPEIGYDLRYDAYISSMDKQTVFMLLVAQYPDYVDQTYAQMSLEAFLNGILTYNPENQLIFADLLLVGGHEALDFFIRAGGVYFKGRAIMVKNSLYLIAMECDVQIYDEQNYNKFVDSFKLVTAEVKTK